MKKESSFDAVEIIVIMAATILGIIVIIQLLEKIFGGSPDEFQLLYGGFSIIIVALLGIIAKLNRIDEGLKYCNLRVSKLEQTLFRIEEKLVRLDERVMSIDNRLINIENKA